MEIRCTQVENYKLTEGKIYRVAGETRDFYQLLNDNNVGVRYSKRLFEVVPEGAQRQEIPTPVIPVTPPPPPVRTEADLIESIDIVDNQVIFYNFENERVAIPNPLNVTSSSISCGVSQTNGINQLMINIDDYFDLDEDDFLMIRTELLKACVLEYIQRRVTGAFTIVSTNVEGEDDGFLADEDMITVLDNLSTTVTPSTRNHNSGRQIKVWVFSRV